jgi:hypothetical protein
MAMKRVRSDSPLRRLVAGLLIAWVLAGCAAPASSSARPPSTAPSAPATAINVDALLGGAAGLDGKPVRVKGYVVVTPAGASLCSVLLESYPPQCGGGVRVTGEIPADVAAGLERTTEPGLAQAMWGWVEVAGTFEADGGGSIALSEIRLAAP